MDTRTQRGVTLIEILVTFAIAALLLTLALPQYSTWLADNQVRNGAQSVSEGLRAAQAAAISRNINAQFVLGVNGWTVQTVDTLQTLQTASFNEGSQRVTFVGVDAANNPATKAASNSLGQVLVPTPPAVNTNIVKVDVTFPVSTPTHMRVMVGNGRTGVKMCDVNAPVTVPPDPKACP